LRVFRVTWFATACVAGMVARPGVASAQAVPWHELSGDDPPPSWSEDPALASEGPARRSRATLGLSFRWAHHPERESMAGGLVLTLPTGGFVPLAARGGSKAKEPAPDVKPAKGGPRATPPAPTPPRAPRGEPDEAREATVAEWVRVSGVDARAAVDAAERHAALRRDEAHLADMASRARWSAALPNLQLRALRLTSETASLVPTAYDPTRITSTGGVSLWLEARATWALDRALFSEEEVRLERIARDIAADRQRLQRRVLDLLFGWQDAVLARLDPTSSFRECRQASLKEDQLTTELDFVTHGWFTRWRADREPLPAPDCFANAERSAPQEASAR
jgi:hypothetical protein